MLQLKPQLVGLGLRQARGPEAGSGLHTERGVARPLPHGVEAWILHGSVAALGHLCLRCILLWEHRGLLLQQDVGILTWELLWIHRLALRRKPPDNKQISETTENCKANRRLFPLTALYWRLLLLHLLHKGTSTLTPFVFPENASVPAIQLLDVRSRGQA